MIPGRRPRMLQKLKEKNVREVSRHLGSMPEEQSDLGTFMVSSPEGNSEAVVYIGDFVAVVVDFAVVLPIIVTVIMCSGRTTWQGRKFGL